ncbi:DHX37 protein [Coprinopsis cinerea okayama7|uniref:RNA helicase n=1 Tax=Coprinopsis cinerea (strain Okayama-7 / 130 / ATCC MYA-4618 / FGSC 9003) TaxID=240176 RepID=A8NRR4_COPC7|nr:DHX37 protein [Coprinopsis cinerea okayama7\|eukprot:XP_001835835.2 DHX37 protein [Coprinopsis cinerea okayama7\
MPPRPVQEIYNTKGRQSTGGTRKKGKINKRKKHAATGDGDGNSAVQPSQPRDSNAEILIPKSKEEREKERKAKLLREEKKLKKEERVHIFEKLAKSQATLSTAVLQSSSTLGSGKTLSHLERLEKEEDAETRKALDGRLGKRKRRREEYDVVHGVDEDDSDEDEDLKPASPSPYLLPHKDVEMEEPPPNEPEPAVVVNSLPQSDPPVVGSALRRNPDGTVVQPKIRQRTKQKQASKRGWGFKRTVEQEPEDSDSSFDSSDSACDSSDSENGGTEDSENEEGYESDGSHAGKSEMEEEPQTEPPPKKKLAFKDWAQKQLSMTKGYVAPIPSDDAPAMETPTTTIEPPRKKVKREGPQDIRGPLGRDLALPTTTFGQHVLKTAKVAATSPSIKVMEVKRPADVEEARLLLPIVTEEQPIVEAIMLNPVVVICGETGSGKTTQVPQFLYEAGFGTPGSDNPGMIGVTQPRRVAAMSMASRVAHELSLASSKVSYQIRYDATVSSSTCIKFMTDGVLLRELATDFLLTKYSVIIIDEAHERSINTDILIGVLSRVIKLREEMWREGKEGAKPLRLIIMSATLRVSDFAENKTLFPTPPPVISVGARQHPVTVHFSRRTSPDYVGEAIKKTVKIHTRLPPGGILIFLTGQNEITGVCRKLEARFGTKVLNAKKQHRATIAAKAHEIFQTEERNVNPSQAAVEVEDLDLGVDDNEDLALDVDDGMAEQDPEALDSDDEDDGVNSELQLEESDVPMHIVPLYSLLPSDKQMKVFEAPPPGTRLVVVATNVAETSLTIPGIRYVVDCGRVKEVGMTWSQVFFRIDSRFQRKYDPATGVQSFHITWTSKASAQQRAGRAGRTGPGHCYRLYSSALFENYFDQFSQPEIQRMPIEGVVLQMKSMHIDAVVNFPFPTPPDRLALQKAERILINLGALKADPTNTPTTSIAKITDLGRAMALFPLAPRFSRMLVSGQQHGCLPYVISIVSALSVGDPFLYEESILQAESSDSESDGSDSDVEVISNAKEERRLKRKMFFQSQHLHSSLGKYTSDIFKTLSVVGAFEYAGGGHKFCADHFVRLKAMEEIHKLRAQISNIVQVNFPASKPNFSVKLPPPSDFQLKVLRQLLTASFIDQVAVRKDRVETTETSGTQFRTAKGVAYRALGITEDVFIHPSSVLVNNSPPDFVIFHEIVRTGRAYMKGVTTINAAWLSKLGKSGGLCTFSKPVKNNAGQVMVIPRFGPHGWELPAIKAEDAS